MTLRVTLLLCLPLPAAATPPSFSDVTGSAGVGYLQHAAAQASSGCIFVSTCEPERMSGGAAVADVDGDGDLDLFATRLDAPDLLFENLGNGSFADASAAAGFDAYDLQSNGAAFGDVDADGDPDLLVTVLGEAGDATNARNYLFLNDGGGGFTEAAVARGADATSPGPRTTYSVSFGDYDLDGWLDLHVSEWSILGTENSRLLHNRGAVAPGFFEDTTDEAGVSLSGVSAFASSFVDLDRDGWPDLAVAGDFGTSRLFWNDGDGSFTEDTVGAGVGTDENGMGSTFGDFDGDGDLDWFVTSIHDPAETCETQPCNWGYSGNRLYAYDGARSFSDATDTAGVRAGYWGWGAVFFDSDNDGDQDLVMTNGVDFPVFTFDDAFNADPMRLWQNDGSGVMTEISAGAGLSDTSSGKGLLVFDYDADGDLDLFVVNNAGAPRLYRNDGGNDNDWLRVRLVGRSSNREGYGAKVRVEASPGGGVREQQVGAIHHFLGQSERVAHFGLGPAAGPVHRVEVVWPSGQSQSLADVAPNQLLVLTEPVPVPALPLPALAALAVTFLGAVAVRLGRRPISPASRPSARAGA
jgi:hypothetical protein